MKSPRGFLAAIVFLSALPVTILYQKLFGNGAEVVIHLALAAGAFLLSFAVFDLSKTPKCGSPGLKTPVPPPLLFGFFLRAKRALHLSRASQQFE